MVPLTERRSPGRGPNLVRKMVSSTFNVLSMRQLRTSKMYCIVYTECISLKLQKSWLKIHMYELPARNC